MKKIIVLFLSIVLLSQFACSTSSNDFKHGQNEREEVAFDGVENENLDYIFNLDNSCTFTYEFDSGSNAYIGVFINTGGGDLIYKRSIGKTISGHNIVKFTISEDKLIDSYFVNINMSVPEGTDYFKSISIKDLDRTKVSNEYPDEETILKEKLYEVNDMDLESFAYEFNLNDSCSFHITFNCKQGYSIQVYDMYDKKSYYNIFGNTVNGLNQLDFTLDKEVLEKVESIMVIIFAEDGKNENLVIYLNELDKSIKSNKNVEKDEITIISKDDGKEKVDNPKLTYLFNLDDSCTFTFTFEGQKGADLNVFDPPKGEKYRNALGKTVDGLNTFEFTIKKDVLENVNDINIVVGRSVLSKTYIYIPVELLDHSFKSNKYPDYNKKEETVVVEQVDDRPLLEKDDGNEKVENEKLEYTIKDDRVDFVFTFDGDAGAEIYVFNPPDGDLFLLDVGETIDGENRIEFSIQKEVLEKIDALLINVYHSDECRTFLTINKDIVLK